MPRLYENTTPFYIRKLSIHKFCYLHGEWGTQNQSPMDTKEQLYIYIHYVATTVEINKTSILQGTLAHFVIRRIAFLKLLDRLRLLTANPILR